MHSLPSNITYGSAANPRSVPLPAAMPVETGSIIRWRRLGMAMLLAGALLIEGGLLIGLVSTTRPVLVHGSALALVGLAFAVSRVTFPEYRLFSRCVIATSIALITALGASFEGVVTVPIFYIWPLLGAAYLLSRVELVLFSAVSVAGCFIASSGAAGPGLEIADYVVLFLVGAVVVVTVRALAETLGTTIGSLRHSSSTDPLTGLLNRRSLERSFARQFESAAAQQAPLSVLMLDVDHFKAINDTYGHAVGDEALCRFAELLLSSCRSTDLVARVGGEEFCVVMPGATADQAYARAVHFANVLRGDRSIAGVRMTASGGVATQEVQLRDHDAMLLAADRAVYEAKRNGRDRIVIASPIAAP